MSKYNNANTDSIEKYLGLAGDMKLSLSQREKYNEKAISLLPDNSKSLQSREFLYKAITNHYQYSKWPRYKQLSKSLLNKALSADDVLHTTNAYRSMGNYFYKATVLDSSFYFYLKAEKGYRQIGDHDGCSTILLKKGIIQYETGNYQDADLSLTHALIVANGSDDNMKIYGLRNQLGLVAIQLRHYEKAIGHFKLGIEAIRRAGKLAKGYEEQTCLSNMGLVYIHKGDYKQALSYYKQAFANKGIKARNLILYCNIIDNLALCRLELNEEIGQLPPLFYEALHIRDSLHLSDNVTSYLNISDYYDSTNDSVKAIRFCKKALNAARHSDSPIYYLTALSFAGGIDKDNASHYITEYARINDSLQFEQRKARSQFYKIQLETDEITKEKEKAVKQKWLVLSMISGVLIIVILLFVVYRQKTKHKELVLQQIQQDANEEIYRLMLNEDIKIEEARQLEKNRIALELHDGVMNKLASTRMNLFVLSKKNDKQTIARCLDYIEDIYTIENEIRSLSHNLNQEIFTEQGSFTILLDELIESQNRNSTVKFKLKMDESIYWDAVPNETKMHLYRIVQEAVNNINKHAQASKALISLFLERNNIKVSVFDDGKGFDTEKTKGGIGLKNIQQRAALLKGALIINSDKDNGTEVLLSFPIN